MNVRLLLSGVAAIVLPIEVFLGYANWMDKASERPVAWKRLQNPQVHEEDRKSLNQRWGGYDADAIRQHWQPFDRAALRAERRFLELDLIFPALYGGALVASLWLSRMALGKSILPFLAVPAVAVTVIADWTENLAQLRVLHACIDARELSLQASAVNLASSATITKLAFFGISSLSVFGFASVVLWRAAKG